MVELLPPIAALPGFSPADWYPIALLLVGMAVFAAIGALSHAHERAYSASLIYLALGVVASALVHRFDVPWLDPLDDARTISRLSEIALVVALFGTGLKLDRPLAFGTWGSVARLIGPVMLLTIAAVAAIGHYGLGLPLGAAIVLGAALAPTDPVLAGDVGVGPPGEEDEREQHFAITAEAGLNDGLALPFLALGLFLAARPGGGWLGEWLLADVLWSVCAGVSIGAAAGYALAAVIVWLRGRDLLSPDYDGWIGVAAVLVVYGAVEAASASGFLAAFAAGLAFRRYERDHELNQRVHQGTEVAEKFGELALILLLGSLLTPTGLSAPGLAGWLLVGALILAIRPSLVLASFARSRLPQRERLFLAWFGVRGIGSVYYVAAALAYGVLAANEERTLFWTIAAAVVVSIVLHGTTSTPVIERLRARDRVDAAPADRSSSVERRIASRRS
jgi:NhaP-type Na+/H+ or K+/H+ antiporter